MSRPPSVVTIDFETAAIERRPVYPPKPVGVSIKYPGKKPAYRAWGHPEGNNTDFATVKRELKDIERSGAEILFHNGKFDYDVMQSHCGTGNIDWRRIHDTLFLLFLDDPHARSFSLKPSAERILGMAPEERDAVRDWLYANKVIAKNQKEWGAHISKAPAGIVGPYANGDTERTEKLFKHLYPIIAKQGMLKAYDRERELMPILLRNEREGMKINLSLLLSDIDLFAKEMSRAEAWLRKRLKSPTLDFEKDRDLAAALKSSGVVTEFVVTASGMDSVAKDNLTPDMFHDNRVARALGYRNRLKTCLDTFMRPWALMAQRTGGTIHTNWNQVRQSHSGDKLGGTRTGRLSSSPNFQNIPKTWHDKDDGYEHPTHLSLAPLPMIRRYVIADDKNSVFINRDYNQQELRILGHFEDGALMNAYAEQDRLDVHNFVRDLIKEVLGMELERRAVKILNFGMIYGMGVGALAGKLHSDAQFAKEIRDAHRKALPDVKDLDDEIKKIGRNGEAIRTWGGRLYYTEEPMMIKGRMVRFEYKLLNYAIQGSAADCTKQAVINYDAIRRDSRFLVTVHDEINASSPKKALKRENALLREAMESVPFDVKMLSDGKIGDNWYDLKDYKEK